MNLGLELICKSIEPCLLRLVVPNKNSCKAEFRTNYTKYWPGTIISFSGNHGRFFYETIKDKQLNKDSFDLDSTNIGRIDLYYDRKIKQSDYVQTLDSFLKNSCTKINSKVDDPKAEVVKGVFRVGKRSSPNSFRVYPKSNGKFIRFELELKKLTKLVVEIKKRLVLVEMVIQILRIVSIRQYLERLLSSLFEKF